MRPKHFLLKFGDHHRLEAEGKEVKRTLLSFLVHPRFKRGSYDNDIALLKMRKRIKFNEFIRPICLPLKGMEKNVRDPNVKSCIDSIIIKMCSRYWVDILTNGPRQK